MRRNLPIMLVLALGLAAIVAVTLLEQHADDRRRAEVRLGELRITLNRVNDAAWDASPPAGGDARAALNQIQTGEASLKRISSDLRLHAPPGALDRLPAALGANFASVERIYEVGSTRGYGVWINHMQGPQAETITQVTQLLDEAKAAYSTSATRASMLGIGGSTAAISILLLAFLILYGRAARARATAEDLARENATLAALNLEDAMTDALTHLANRRALLKDVEVALAEARDGRPLMLALFDLDGFKQYNDTFGHGAGDALLARLGAALQGVCSHGATAYRMGGDEFCLLVRDGEHDGRALVSSAIAALSEKGEQWTIGCSAGVVWLPHEATDLSEALGLADSRMYAQKASRASAGRQTTDALLCVLRERSPSLDTHTSSVAAMAEATARAIGVEERQIAEIVWAAQLHDVGKAAIPDAILNKPGPLDEEEWKLMRRHTLIGERIMVQAHALADAARLVRASHERFDGRGYPDGLHGTEIPLGARIIFVCDAFDAMTATRSYKRAMGLPEAIAELRGCAGTQFDPGVVDALCGLLAKGAFDQPGALAA